MSCYDCGIKYGGDAWIELVIPDKIWNKIKPKGCGDGAGILCANCIVRRLSIMKFKNVPAWMCGTEPIDVHSGDPADNLGTLRVWDQGV